MADRARIAEIAQLLRDARDGLEVANDPYDVTLGAIHARLAVLVNDLRAASTTPATLPATVTLPFLGRAR